MQLGAMGAIAENDQDDEIRQIPENLKKVQLGAIGANGCKWVQLRAKIA